ncbi:hypothetical protein HYV80_05310 [Candidatus Woesearchaeota archaeon]|nr:hypothetical protein [Candidatus Woesearchaeota archaeon]
MVILKLDDLAGLLGKTRFEVEEMLKSSDIIELNLNERKQRFEEDSDDLKIYE